MSDSAAICCLCGKPATDDDRITREHVPPKQFYPKSMRDGLNLWTVPAHKTCNNKYKLDEEYFFHALYPLVAKTNPQIASMILDDLKRRAEKPQTPTLIRSILRTKRERLEGGILLPPGVIQLSASEHRLQQVAIKIGRCLFYRDHQRVMPYENCRDIRLCESEEDVPEMYRLSWELSRTNFNDYVPKDPSGLELVTDTKAGQPLTACPQVFSYREACLEQENLHLYTVMFWGSFVYCMAFSEAQAILTCPRE